MSDLISRQAVIHGLDNIEIKRNGTWYELYQKAINMINELPSVEPERKTGMWIDGKCNRCGTHAPFWEMATTYYCSEYCPKCGAEMIEPQESEDME